ncbi:YdcF family protein [Reichenbachiella sp. MALMAid0571]|uniref:YdcF family protein n=1 Tax=Reichenbachiella sp. MALMAid0571 TaxID=3143939 RepID=UPI0032DFB616
MTTLIMPVSLISMAFVLSFFYKKKRKQLQLTAIILLFVFSNPFLAHTLMKWWEVPSISINSIIKPYPIGVVLCGVTNTRLKPRDRVHFQKGADRIIHAVQLYKEGKIKKILISGGSGSLLYPEESESNDLNHFALMAGVKKRDIILENESRNTHENALNSGKIIKEENIKGNVLLITSAFHMKRAQACFKKENVKFDVFSTDLHSGEMEYSPIDLIVPNVGAIKTWTILLKEWIGMAAYKVSGYI